MTIWDEIDTIYNQAGENGEDACTFSVPGTFSGYRGHFPGNPILPGIVQLSFIRRLAERRLARPLRLAGVRLCVEQAFADRAVKQVRFLAYDTDAPS